jgi:hypothetical protein
MGASLLEGAHCKRGGAAPLYTKKERSECGVHHALKPALRTRPPLPLPCQVIGELLQPGQRLLVAKGGKGGAGVRAPSRDDNKASLAREMKMAQVRGLMSQGVIP